MAGIVQVVSQLVTSERIFATACILVAVSFVADLIRRPTYPDSLPRVGYGKGVVGAIKNYFLSFYWHKTWVQEGYEKVSPTTARERSGSE